MSTCWLAFPAGAPWDLHALPYGSFSTAQDDRVRVGIDLHDAVGDERKDTAGA